MQKISEQRSRTTQNGSHKKVTVFPKWFCKRPFSKINKTCQNVGIQTESENSEFAFGSDR